MRRALLVQVTVYDEDTGKVEEQTVKTYTGCYGYEIERMFEKIGEKLALKLDPSHGRD